MLLPEEYENLTDAELVKECNKLARLYYLMHGYQEKEGYRFDKAFHPQERSMWNLAATAFTVLLNIDIENALASVMEDEEESIEDE